MNTIPVLFDREGILAVAKPEGLATIPGRGEGGRESLLARLEAEQGSRLFVVHRLDREVSGVLLFARDATVHRLLNRQFEERIPKKVYLALVLGAVAREAGEIDQPIRAYGSGRMGVDMARGKPSVTGYRVLERPGGCTLLEALPVTGRRHQIRVHLYSLGHPIAGDPFYGSKNVQSGYPRLMLHARAITFRLPSGGTETVTAPVPASFEDVLAAVREGGDGATGGLAP